MIFFFINLNHWRSKIEWQSLNWKKKTADLKNTFRSDVAKLQPFYTYHAGDVIGQLVTLPKPVPLPSN